MGYLSCLLCMFAVDILIQTLRTNKYFCICMTLYINTVKHSGLFEWFCLNIVNFSQQPNTTIMSQDPTGLQICFYSD